MFWATIFIVFGLVMLLKNLDIIQSRVWEVAWPILLIIFGFSLLNRRATRLHLPWCTCDNCKRNTQV